MDLLQTLISTLNISEAQAKAGLGAILGLAKSKVSTETFTEIGKLIPELAELIKSAPAAGGLGALGGLLGGHLAELAKLAGQFKSAGMSQQQMAPFAKVAFTFLHENLPEAARTELTKLAESLKK